MKYLFNRSGQHIANLVNNQLHHPHGKNIGHFLPDYNIFIDMRGRYLGEVVQNDRLLAHRNSPYRNMSFGVYGNYGNVGNYGNPGNHGSTGMISGYDDIDPLQLGK